jgi:hypothetical protein
MGTSLVKHNPAVVEAEIVLRNPRLPISRSLLHAAAIIVFMGVYVWLHDQFHRHPVSRLYEIAFFMLFALALTMALLMDEVVSPAWIGISRGGLTVGRSFRLQRYAWTQIRWFAVQDKPGSHPPLPRAMMVLERESSLMSPDAVRLPALREWPPADLVALLEEKRKIYS